MRITLSSMQYTMLRIVKQQKVFNMKEAALYRQPTYSSMVRRGYLVTEQDSEGDVVFKVTPAAGAALSQFDSEDVYRQRESASLSKFLERYVHRSQRRRAS